MPTEKEYREENLRTSFELSLPRQVDRSLRAQVHSIIGNEYFSVASRECYDMFVTGHFYGCITLCQSVAEGLARFIAERSGMRPPGEFEENVATLRKRNLISEDVCKALLAIHGKDRNDFHHLNKEIERDYKKL